MTVVQINRKDLYVHGKEPSKRIWFSLLCTLVGSLGIGEGFRFGVRGWLLCCRVKKANVCIVVSPGLEGMNWEKKVHWGKGSDLFEGCRCGKVHEQMIRIRIDPIPDPEWRVCVK